MLPCNKSAAIKCPLEKITSAHLEKITSAHLEKITNYLERLLKSRLVRIKYYCGNPGRCKLQAHSHPSECAHNLQNAAELTASVSFAVTK